MGTQQSHSSSRGSGPDTATRGAESDGSEGGHAMPTTVALPPTGASGFKMDLKHIQMPLAGLGWNSGGHIQTVLFRCTDLGSLDREKAEKGIHQPRTMSQSSPAAAQPLLFSVVPPTAAQGKQSNLIFTPRYLETTQNRYTYLHFHTTAVLIIAPGTIRGTLTCVKKQSLAEGTGDVPKSRTHIVISISKHGSYSWTETQTSLVNPRSSPLLFPSSRANPSPKGLPLPVGTQQYIDSDPTTRTHSLGKSLLHPAKPRQPRLG